LAYFNATKLTNVGRALTKHPEVLGFNSTESLMKVLRNPDAINKAASNALKNIMRAGIRTENTHKRYGKIVTYQINGGYGARWYSNGDFIGFINP
jgi:hypothetical protein